MPSKQNALLPGEPRTQDARIGTGWQRSVVRYYAHRPRISSQTCHRDTNTSQREEAKTLEDAGVQKPIPRSTRNVTRQPLRERPAAARNQKLGRLKEILDTKEGACKDDVMNQRVWMTGTAGKVLPEKGREKSFKESFTGGGSLDIQLGFKRHQLPPARKPMPKPDVKKPPQQPPGTRTWVGGVYLKPSKLNARVNDNSNKRKRVDDNKVVEEARHRPTKRVDNTKHKRVVDNKDDDDGCKPPKKELSQSPSESRASSPGADSLFGETTSTRDDDEASKPVNDADLETGLAQAFEEQANDQPESASTNASVTQKSPESLHEAPAADMVTGSDGEEQGDKPELAKPDQVERRATDSSSKPQKASALSSTPSNPTASKATSGSAGKKRPREDSSESEPPVKKAKPTAPVRKRSVLNGRGVAQKVVKGARSGNSSGSGSSSSSTTNGKSGTSGGQPSKPNATRLDDTAKAHAALEKARRMSALTVKDLRGLTNSGLACFSNVTLQLLNAALSSEDLEKLLIDGDDLEMFGFSIDDFLSYDIQEYNSGGMSTKQEAELLVLRDEIEKEAKDRNISVAAYVGQLIKDLRTGLNEVSSLGKTDMFASPLLAQQVVAFTDKARNHMSGATEEDAAEYFTLLLEVIGREHPFLHDLFEIREQEAIKCTACSHIINKPEVSQTHFKVRVPEQNALPARQKEADFIDVVKDAIKQRKNEPLDGYKCDHCERTSTCTKTTKITKVSKHLVVQVDRVHAQDQKVTTAMDLCIDEEIVLKGKAYKLHGVVRHLSRKGKTGQGHYTFEQLHKGQWYRIDDKNVKSIPKPVDGLRGHSAMLLFKQITETS